MIQLNGFQHFFCIFNKSIISNAFSPQNCSLWAYNKKHRLWPLTFYRLSLITCGFQGDAWRKEDWVIINAAMYLSESDNGVIHVTSTLVWEICREMDATHTEEIQNY